MKVDEYVSQLSEHRSPTGYVDLGHIKYELSSFDDANVYMRVFREPVRRQKVSETCQISNAMSSIAVSKPQVSEQRR